jgi:hypothetical protein
MTPTRMRDLLAAALVTGLLANLVVSLGYGSLPDFPLLAGVTLGVLGGAEAIAGTALRNRIRRVPGSRPVEPLVAARAVLVAKASALAGAIVAGAWAGLLAYALPRAGELTAAAGDTAAASVGLACSAGLVAGGLWLEHCCRTPDDEHRGRRDPGRSRGG